MKILQGNDALKKANSMMESIGNPSKMVNTFSNIESIHLAHNGKSYAVVKEYSDYVLKVGNKKNPKKLEDFDYINGIGNKSKNTRKTYTESVRILNLMDIEWKRLHGDKLIKEAQNLDEKTVLKIKNPNPAPSQDMSMSNDAPEMSADSETSDDTVPEMSDDGAEDFGNSENTESADGSENPDDYADVDPDDLETDDPLKMIQKLSGKLAYELRDFDDADKYSDAAKFAMSMTTSALQTDKMSDSDKSSIAKKITSKLDSTTDSEGDDSEGTDFGSDDLDNVEGSEGGGKMKESFKITKKKLLEVFKKTKKPIKEDIFFEFDDDYTDDVSDDEFLFDAEDVYDDNEIQNMYDVPEEKILFDIEEDVYSEPVRAPKNRQFQTSIGSTTVGRIEGDDDAMFDNFTKLSKPNTNTTNFTQSKQIKRNPFKYNK